MSEELHEGLLYEKLPEGKVRCNLCAHRCLIFDGQFGICQVRENRQGVLYSLVYGQLTSRAVDPVEKKPLFHFYPGSGAYSIATPGCNFRCRWCQNWEISQAPRDEHIIQGMYTEPEEVVRAAAARRCRSIAYTYTEPTIFYEYAYDTACLAHEAGLANIFVTNGYMTAEMLDHFHPLLDAANVDLKAFNDETYRHAIGARLDPVLESLKKMRKLGIWLEITTLIIPGVNDDSRELMELAHFIAGECGPETPWHVSRYHPNYKLTEPPPTPLAVLMEAQRIGKEAGLKYIYTGNVPGEENTYCPQCGTLLIRRSGYFIMENNIDGRSCPHCGQIIAGVGLSGRPMQ